MGVATTLAIVGIASAATSAYGAHKSAGASKKASELQQQSGREALDFQRNIYNQQQAMQSPFVGVGQQAAMTLGRLSGVTPGARFAAPPMQAPMGMGPMGPIGMGGGMGMGMPMRPPQQMGGGMPMGMGPMPMQMQRPPQTLGSLAFNPRIAGEF